MSSKEEAIKLLGLLNGSKVFDGRCKLHLYFSALEEIDLKNRFSNGKDFGSTEASSMGDYADVELDQLLQEPSIWPTEFKKYKTADSYYLHEVINTFQHEPLAKSTV